MEVKTGTRVETGFSGILKENNSTMEKIKNFEKAPISTKARNVGYGLFTVGALFVAGLFATTIISGIFALVVTGLFCVGSYFGLRFLKTLDPLIQQKTKNFKIDAMINEARTHAIAQLDNQVIENHNRLKSARVARDKMGALVEKLRGQINPANVGTPMYEKKTKMLDRVSSAYEKMKAGLELASSTNKEFEKKVYEYKQMDAFTNLANEALAYSSSSDNKLDEMLSLAAFEQIETSFSTALISIENSADDMERDNS